MTDYIIKEQLGFCKACNKYDDLRFKVCFTCADSIKSDGTYAWSVFKPEYKWLVNNE